MGLKKMAALAQLGDVAPLGDASPGPRSSTAHPSARSPTVAWRDEARRRAAHCVAIAARAAAARLVALRQGSQGQPAGGGSWGAPRAEDELAKEHAGGRRGDAAADQDQGRPARFLGSCRASESHMLSFVTFVWCLLAGATTTKGEKGNPPQGRGRCPRRGGATHPHQCRAPTPVVLSSILTFGRFFSSSALAVLPAAPRCRGPHDRGSGQARAAQI